MGDFVNPSECDGKLFGYKLTGRYMPLLITGGGIFFCYCCSGISQEYLYSTGFHYTSYLTLVAKVTAVLWGALGGGLSPRRSPHSAHIFIGVLSFLTMWLSNQSLLTLNYPSQTLFKSAKLIPVMIGALVINQKRFHILEYLSAILLLGGLVCFTLTDANITPNFDPIGVLFVSSALIADALIGNYQEKMFKSYGSSANEMMTYSSGYAAMLSVIGCWIEGDNMAATKFLINDPIALISLLFYCLLNILGIYFVLVMICIFGATLTTFTTSLRKAASVCLSFLIYPKPFAMGYVLGGISTMLGIACNMKAAQIKRMLSEQQKDADHSEERAEGLAMMNGESSSLLSDSGDGNNTHDSNGMNGSAIIELKSLLSSMEKNHTNFHLNGKPKSASASRSQSSHHLSKTAETVENHSPPLSPSDSLNTSGLLASLDAVPTRQKGNELHKSKPFNVDDHDLFLANEIATISDEEDGI